MIAFMIRNVQTGEWFVNYKKRGYSNIPKWTFKMKQGSIWLNKAGPIQAMRANKLDANEAEIVEFRLEEIE